MKDEHDKSTLPLAELEASTLLARDPQGRALSHAKLIMDRRLRAMQGLVTLLPVSMVAKEWVVSPRRVRALLLAGRLAGQQGENGYWEVCYPYTITEGRRGPQMRRKAPKKPELRLV